MNAEKTYYLWYTGAGHHEVLDEAKRELDLRLAERYASSGTPDGARMAEAILDHVRFQDHARERYAAATGRPLDLRKEHSREIDHVHAACEAEIRAKWADPVMPIEEVADALFLETVQEELREHLDGLEVDLGF